MQVGLHQQQYDACATFPFLLVILQLLLLKQ